MKLSQAQWLVYQMVARDIIQPSTYNKNKNKNIKNTMKLQETFCSEHLTMNNNKIKL